MYYVFIEKQGLFYRTKSEYNMFAQLHQYWQVRTTALPQTKSFHLSGEYFSFKIGTKNKIFYF